MAKNDGETTQPARWLTADEREAWLSVVRVAMRLPAMLDAQLERDAGLNFFEYTVLAMLSEQPTRTLGMSQLAARTSASLSRLSNVVKRLEQRGYLRRQADPDDGRCTQAVLTDAGMVKVVQTAPGHVEAARQFVIDAVSPTQLRQLQAANDRILRRIDPEATTRPPAVDSSSRPG
ncbi:MAG TPA: MarR family transcriptional regulator [Actinomycetes bacterium]|jgi:DNA-binding MarR family transcriptional regulator|nr:MarR family transcriptional regulator [Actinomycetota bacterium]HEV3495401.1 MarR family transcriptional regulator [Actinomycetes bacterium]HEX2157635.1 MarR family transcriptional regulator [Actinomycetes bacterium]